MYDQADIEDDDENDEDVVYMHGNHIIHVVKYCQPK